MSNDKTRAGRLACALLMGGAMIPEIDLPEASEELCRLSASEAALLAALEMAVLIIGHPDDAVSQEFADLIARTKEARNV